MKTAKSRFSFFLGYLLILSLGLAFIYLAQFRSHQYLDLYCKEASNEISMNGRISNYDIYLPAGVYYYSPDGIIAMHVNYRQRGLDFEGFVEDNASYYENKQSTYRINLDNSSLGWTAFATRPVWFHGKCIGQLYLVTKLEHMRLLIWIYIAAASVIYASIVFVYLNRLATHQRLESIYRQYIANISHELKTPIASIQAITEILTDGGGISEAERSQYYGIILNESKRLERSVYQIIKLSKLQDRKITYKLESADPHALFDPIRERFQPRCEDIDIYFSIEESVYSLPRLYTDVERMQELIEILLDNAYKFVHEGGHITIAAKQDTDSAIICVKDDGRGIAKEDIPFIFDRFYKTDIGNRSGTGLGLTIAREIAEGLHEKMWVHSEPGHGASFYFTIKIEERDG